MTTQAIRWVRSVKSLTPDKPFFIYFAPGATHAPHHVPKSWIAKYRGKFDQGWDKLREQTLARQIKLGVVPPGTRLARKPTAIKDWDKLTAAEKKLFAHQMEVFAAYGEYADSEIGRLISALKDQGQLDNTLIFYVLGDNGASAEGGMSGLFSEMTYFNGVTETVQDILKHYSELGGPSAYGHYAAGWAVAGDTPFTWTKQIPSSYGGTRNGMVIHWPKKIKAKNQIRSQWHHVIDIAPTILEAAGLPEPKEVDGIPQTPIEGVSMLATFNDAKAKETHVTQYFEVFGNRGIYHDGWLAGTIHRAPWEMKPRRPMAEDIWELYDTRQDFSLTRDLAAQNPEKLKEMQKLFLSEASKYSVLPIDDRSIERVNAATAGRPDLMAGRTSLTVYEGMTGMSENVFINTKNRSHSIVAEIRIPKGGANGVVLSQAGRFGGWSLYLRQGVPVYTYNFLGLESYSVVAKSPLPVGKVTLRYDFAYDGGGLGKGGVGTLQVNGKPVAQGRIQRTQFNLFSADEGADVGEDAETAVTNYKGMAAPYRFTGKIDKITIQLKTPDAALLSTEKAAQAEANRRKTLSD
jgi:arylsulfatase